MQIGIAQFLGIFLVLVPSFILGGIHRTHVNIFWLVVFVTIIYFACVEISPKHGVMESAERLERYRTALSFLILADMAIILGVIGLSGGIFKSHLGFVLLLIPVSVAFVRGGGATLLGTAAIVLGIVGLETYAISTGRSEIAPSTICATFLQRLSTGTRGIPFDKADASGADPVLYGIAYAVGIGISILISVYQSRLSSGRTIPDHIQHQVSSELSDPLNLTPAARSHLEKAVARAYHRMSRLVSRTAMPEIHCSVVHPLEDVVFQAYLLASPGRFKTEERLFFQQSAMDCAAEMVFAVHWLDDAFDRFGYPGIPDSGGEAVKTEFQKTTYDIGKFYSPYGINRVLSAVKGESRFALFRWRPYPKRPWDAGVELGLMRVVLAGFIQHGTPAQRAGAISSLRASLDSLVRDAELRKQLASANAEFLWGISKTDMPLVLGMFWSPKSISALPEGSIVLDALFMPLLIWHDLEEEIKREGVPKVAFDGTIPLREGVADAVKTATELIESAEEHAVFDSRAWKAVKPILQIVFNLWQPRMPKDEIHDRYRRQVRKRLES